MLGRVRKKAMSYRALVGGAVGADQTGPVEGEGDVEVLQADVVHDLVVGTLQEGRVDGGHRLHALGRESRREGDGVLLGDADVVEAVRELALEAIEPGPRGHRRRDRDDALVLPREPDQGVGEDAGVGRRARLARCEATRGDVEARRHRGT